MDGDIIRNSYDDGSQDLLTGEQRIRNFNINFGPQHPAAHGVLRLVTARHVPPRHAASPTAKDCLRVRPWRDVRTISARYSAQRYGLFQANGSSRRVYG